LSSVTDSRTLDDWDRGGFDDWGRGFKSRGASLNGNASLFSTETTVLIGSNADSLFLSEALRVLSSSLSLGEVDSLKNRYGTLNSECSVLCLNCKSGVCCLSAFAAVSLANLIELSVRDGIELGNLAGFSVLLVALADTGTEAWELGELAGALNIEGRQVKTTHFHVA
jgi:hypothetical protein